MHATDPEPSSPGHPSLSTTASARRAARLHRWMLAAAILGIAATLVTGWMGAARAATTDELQALQGRLDERVDATRATSARLTAAIAAARAVRGDVGGADAGARKSLDDAIRAAEAVAGQRLTTQEPGSVAQAQMLVRQAGLIEETLGLAAADLHAAVEQVRGSEAGFRPVRQQLVPGGSAGGMVVVQP